jgi:hypothetical protein
MNSKAQETLLKVFMDSNIGEASFHVFMDSNVIKVVLGLTKHLTMKMHGGTEA